MTRWTSKYKTRHWVSWLLHIQIKFFVEDLKLSTISPWKMTLSTNSTSWFMEKKKKKAIMTVLTILTVQTIKTTSLTFLFCFFGNFTFYDYMIQAKLVLATFHLLTIYDVINSKHLWYISYKYCLQIHHKRKKFLVTYFVEVLTTLTLDTACFSVLFSFWNIKEKQLALLTALQSPEGANHFPHDVEGTRMINRSNL